MTQSLAVPEKNLTPSDSYSRLREEVKKVLLLGRRRAEVLVEGEKIRTYWEVGRLIDRHIQAEKPEAKRAEYGKQVVKRLARDFRMSET